MIANKFSWLAAAVLIATPISTLASDTTLSSETLQAKFCIYDDAIYSDGAIFYMPYAGTFQCQVNETYPEWVKYSINEPEAGNKSTNNITLGQ